MKSFTGKFVGVCFPGFVSVGIAFCAVALLMASPFAGADGSVDLQNHRTAQVSSESVAPADRAGSLAADIVKGAREEARHAPDGRLVIVKGASHSIQNRERGHADYSETGRRAENGAFGAGPQAVSPRQHVCRDVAPICHASTPARAVPGSSAATTADVAARRRCRLVSS